MYIKGYRAKIKQGSVHFWHMCAFSQRRTYNQKWPIQVVCNYLLQVLQVGQLGQQQAWRALSPGRLYMSMHRTSLLNFLLLSYRMTKWSLDYLEWITC